MLCYNKKLSPQNKAVLITGCANGFGYALAQRLDSKGFLVFASCLNPHSDGAERLKESGSDRLHVFGLDVRKDESVQAALDYVKKHLNGTEFWGLVNNAGRHSSCEITWASLEDFQYMMDVNAMGTIRVTKVFLSLLRKSKGRIVNVTSLAASHPIHITSTYAVSKAAVAAFSECLKQEMHPWGVKVITIEPEFFRTNMLDHEAEYPNMEECFKLLDPEVKEEYGDEYLKAFSAAMKQLYDTSSDRISKVTDALEDAISLNNPRSCYKPSRNFLFEWAFHLSDFLPKPIIHTIFRAAYNYLGYPKPQKASR